MATRLAQGEISGPPASTRKMAWLMPRMAKAVPSLGYILITGTKPGCPPAHPVDVGIPE